MKRVTLAVVLAAVGIGMAVAWDPAFSPASCGDCPTDFTLYGSVGTDLALGGGAYACPWICQCAKTNSSDGSRLCFSCSNGADSNIEVIALFTGKDTNLVSSALDTAQTAMSGWISNRMAEVMEVVNSCTTEERLEKTSEERLELGEESKSGRRSVSLGFNSGGLINPQFTISGAPPPTAPTPPPQYSCDYFLQDDVYGNAKLDEWNANNLGTADVWGLGSPKTYKELMEDELNNDPGFTDNQGTVWDITWEVFVLDIPGDVDNKYIQVRRIGNGPCDSIGNPCTGEDSEGKIMYYAYLSKYEGVITSSSGDLVFTKIASIVHKPPGYCIGTSETANIEARLNGYQEAGEPVIKQALNKVRFQVLKDMTSGT